MSVQAGIWHYDKRPVSRVQLERIEQQMAPQGPDARGEFVDSGFAMLHRAFYITAEDELETQPLLDPHGDVLTWDGRLDNRQELLSALGRSPLELPSDVEIVSATLAAWGNKALTRLLGDWALAWWSPREQRLVLARDYIGVRKLYYLTTENSLYWSTDLAALVLHAGQSYSLCDAYFAGYFTTYSEPQLTPYREIQLIPPGGLVEATPKNVRVSRYWSFDSTPEICYRSDGEYEEHFRHVFRQAVRRRMRTGYPILADLSGGLDSSAIVCMAYDILKAGEASATINTQSMYSLDEPGGDERPYFAAVENEIGKVGSHIEVSNNNNNALSPLREHYFSPLPGYFDRAVDGEARLLSYTQEQGNRVHMSGLGGDELLGGLQNPIPDLAWLLWHLRLPSYWRQLQAWALQQKSTIWTLLARSSLSLAPLWFRTRLDGGADQHPTSWLRPQFVKRQHISSRNIRAIRSWRDYLPGLGSPDAGYLSLAASIAGYLPRFTFAEQSCLPYFDRDLVQFRFAIPGEQILRPHQRRSLMRRSLQHIVPAKVLSRKTKWLGRRLPALNLLDSVEVMCRLLPNTVIAERYIDQDKMLEALAEVRQGISTSTFLLERAFGTCYLYWDLASRGRLTSLDAAMLEWRDLRPRVT